MKINWKELAHYIVGGIALLAIWIPLMNFLGNVYLTSVVWLLGYIVIDQILHKLIMKHDVSIIKI